jgi:aminoglycoside phosphotransferase (APT) family kinase protein
LPRFRAEAAVTEYLHHEVPGAVAHVIASETTEGWLLLDDFDGDTLSSDPSSHAQAIDRLVALQKSFVGRADDLIAAGCEARQLHTLPAAFTEAMTSPVAQDWLVVAPARLKQMSSWLDQAIASISELGIDDTLVHGDFHPGNVALSNGRPIIFDWSDASVGNPLVDIGAWATRFLDDPASAEALWSMFFRAWSDVVPFTQLEALRPAIQGVAHAFHAVSYAGILEGLESNRRIELADRLTNFFGRLDAAVPHA